MKKLVVFVIFLISNQCILGQIKISSIVQDAKTFAPLAFASVTIIDEKKGTTTDIDGKFIIWAKDKNSKIKVSYLGYQPKTIEVKDLVDKILLNPLSRRLEDVVVDNKINLAHRIIDSFLFNKKNNNPLNYKSFSYNVYTKAGIAGEDYFWREIIDKVDTVFVDSSNFKQYLIRNDSLLKKMTPKELAIKKQKDSLENIQKIKDSISEQLIRKNYIVFTESYTQKYFKYPNRHKEIVLATKFSGIDKANFSFTSSNFQPFGLYTNFIDMLGKSYQSPLAASCKKDYRFFLKDILINNDDTTFIITYKPKKGKKFLGLEGTIFINSNSWGLEDFIAQPYKDTGKLMSFKLQQKYTLINKKWFPQQFNTIINKRDSKNDSSIIYWDSKSYFSNIKIDEAIENRVFDDVALDYNDNAGEVEDSLWRKYRVDTLDKKGANTYEAYTLIPEEAKKVFNKFPRILEAIAAQSIPWGKFNIPIKHFFAVNQYEKFRIGFGLITNNHFSKHFNLGANIAYGFGDKSLKYGALASYYLSKKRSTSLTFSFKQDVEEPGLVNYFKENDLTTFKTFRNLLVENMDSVQEFKLAFSTKLNGKLKFDTWLSKQQRNQGFSNYTFQLDNGIYTQAFTNTEYGMGIKYAINETYTKLGSVKILKHPATTQFLLNYTKGLSNFLNGDLSYDKVAFQFNHKFNTRIFGETKWQLLGGKIWGNVPYSLLFNTLASNGTRYRLISPYIQNHFQTVGLYEFTSDRLLQFSWEQNFGSLIFKPNSLKFKPEISLTTNIAYGWLQNKTIHKNINLKSIEDGLFESGVILKNLFRTNIADFYYLGLGIGAFYRYGANSNDSFKDNVSFRFAMSVDF